MYTIKEIFAIKQEVRDVNDLGYQASDGKETASLGIKETSKENPIRNTARTVQFSLDGFRHHGLRGSRVSVYKSIKVGSDGLAY
jgi:hypothetical protein